MGLSDRIQVLVLILVLATEEIRGQSSDIVIEGECSLRCTREDGRVVCHATYEVEEETLCSTVETTTLASVRTTNEIVFEGDCAMRCIRGEDGVVCHTTYRLHDDDLCDIGETTDAMTPAATTGSPGYVTNDTSSTSPSPTTTGVPVEYQTEIITEIIDITERPSGPTTSPVGPGGSSSEPSTQPPTNRTEPVTGPPGVTELHPPSPNSGDPHNIYTLPTTEVSLTTKAESDTELPETTWPTTEEPSWNHTVSPTGETPITEENEVTGLPETTEWSLMSSTAYTEEPSDTGTPSTSEELSTTSEQSPVSSTTREPSGNHTVSPTVTEGRTTTVSHNTTESLPNSTPETPPPSTKPPTTTPGPSTELPAIPRDCHDVYLSGSECDGVYTIYPTGWYGVPFDVDCKMSHGGGWTVIQRREDGLEEFYRSWSQYKLGFGTPHREHWLGNERLHYLVNQSNYELRIDLMNRDGHSYHLTYDHFHIGDEWQNYKLDVLGDFAGNTGYDYMDFHRGRVFSTYDNSHNHCPETFRGGWWYNACYDANLNGDYNSTTYPGVCLYDRYATGTYQYQLRFTEMKVRPL